MIGLRLYQVTMFHQHRKQRLSIDGGPTDLASFTRSFVSRFSSKVIKGGDSKTVRFQPQSDVGDSQHGWVRYGTYGFESEAEDVTSGQVVHTKTKDQADTIPLYYRFWNEPNRSYALWALQSYSGRSCVDLIRQTFRDVYQEGFPDYSVQIAKIMPNDAALYGQRSVRRITLVRRSFPSNKVNAALQPEKPGVDLDLELLITPQSKGTFGRLKDVTGRLGGNLRIDNLDFQGAFAEVRVGNSLKKIGILGLTSSAGVIDISDDVALDPQTVHPTLASIAKASEDNIKNFAKGLGP